MVVSTAYQSINTPGKLQIAPGILMRPLRAPKPEAETVFVDRIINELVTRFRERNIDRTEVACLRAMMLIDPGES